MQFGGRQATAAVVASPACGLLVSAALVRSAIAMVLLATVSRLDVVLHPVHLPAHHIVRARSWCSCVTFADWDAECAFRTRDAADAGAAAGSGTPFLMWIAELLTASAAAGSLTKRVTPSPDFLAQPNCGSTPRAASTSMGAASRCASLCAK